MNLWLYRLTVIRTLTTDDRARFGAGMEADFSALHRIKQDRCLSNRRFNKFQVIAHMWLDNLE